jgi:arylsulfatase A-like enzyme
MSLVLMAACQTHLGAFFGEGGAKRPPNFVIILTDDQGYGDLGCYGGQDVETPHCDRLAAEGVRFASFYTCSPVCTPSRAALLTGRYPVRSGLSRVLWPHSRKGIGESEITIAEALRSAGYATACVGKWHLGCRPEHLPRRHGFDTFYGMPYSNDMNWRRLTPYPAPLMRDEAVIEQPVKLDALTRRYTDEALRFMNEQHDRPFFLYLAHSMPHVPLGVSKESAGTSRRGLYGDVIAEIDGSVGEIVARIRELELERDTIVVYASDNGPWLWKGAHGGSAGGLREGKGTTFEGGVRVPCIAWGPGYVRGGRVEEAPAMLLDWFPTFLRLAGVATPADRAIDGRNIEPVLAGTGERGGDEFFFFRHEELQAYRSGPWKFIRPFSGVVYMKRIRHPRLLFRVDEDPGETRNVAHEYPDVVLRMTERMREFQREVLRP